MPASDPFVSPTSALAVGLARHEPVLYADNGFRSSDGKALLTRLERLLPTLGVSRIAELSQLSPLGFPVYQSTRPGIISHPECGQNTGSQGKGRTPLQSKLSCLMEELESICAEPRAPLLVRANYEVLRRRGLVIDPATLTCCEGGPAHHDEALMWIRGWRLAAFQQPGADVWLPAETVFFPFFPERYATASRFPCSSNGLAAGASYLEAVVHGLYEVVERAYQAFYQRGEARVRDITATALDMHLDKRARGLFGDPDAIELLTIELPPARHNLPMVVCLIHNAHCSYAGYGCSATVEISIARAVSEALQAYAVDISGSREDLAAVRPTTTKRVGAKRHSLESYRARVINKTFDTLNQEFEHLCHWVRSFGFPEIVVCDLTRGGIDIPVVKVVVPGLPCPDSLRQQRMASHCVDESTRLRFGLCAAAKITPQQSHTRQSYAPRVKVYAGLSVQEEHVKKVLPDAVFSPPAARGDILRDARDGIDVVLLIDGRFQQTLAVSVGEIADALRVGVCVYGAASMGALRATELRHCGMIAHGAIAEWVASEPYFRDDYLGLHYNSEHPQSLGVAYVDVHFALLQMQCEGRLSESQRMLLDSCYRNLHFAERDRAGFLLALVDYPDSDPLSALANEALSRPSQKRTDALGLLSRVARELSQLHRQRRALEGSLAGVRRFPFFEVGGALDISLTL